MGNLKSYVTLHNRHSMAILSRFDTFDINIGEICLFESNFFIDFSFNVFQGVEEQTQYLKDSKKPIMHILKNDKFQGKK